MPRVSDILAVMRFNRLIGRDPLGRDREYCFGAVGRAMEAPRDCCPSRDAVGEGTPVEGGRFVIYRGPNGRATPNPGECFRWWAERGFDDLRRYRRQKRFRKEYGDNPF